MDLVLYFALKKHYFLGGIVDRIRPFFSDTTKAFYEKTIKIRRKKKDKAGKIRLAPSWIFYLLKIWKFIKAFHG